MNTPTDNPVAADRHTLPGSGRNAPAQDWIYERKFWISEDAIDPLLSLVGEQLSMDPFTVSAGGSYEVHSLYFDTPRFDIFHANRGWENITFRVRQYGTGDSVFLEFKSRRDGCIRKRRTQVSAAEIAYLHDAEHSDGWPGAWFRRRLCSLDLRPACQVSYMRSALSGAIQGRPLRITLDRRLRGEERNALSRPSPLPDSPPLLPRMAILEVKYADAMPETLQDLVREFRLQQANVSKYHRVVRALALPGANLPS